MKVANIPHSRLLMCRVITSGFGRHLAAMGGVGVWSTMAPGCHDIVFGLAFVGFLWGEVAVGGGVLLALMITLVGRPRIVGSNGELRVISIYGELDGLSAFLIFGGAFLLVVLSEQVSSWIDGHLERRTGKTV